MTAFPRDLDRDFSEFAARAARCDNLGESGDERDLFAVIEALIAHLHDILPPFACREGCNQCCYTPPLVTGTEWQLVHRHLLALPPDERQRVVAMAENQRPLARRLDEMRQQALQAEPGDPSSSMVQCPLLVDGLCAVYAARPLICRMYGYAGYSRAGRERFFGSELAFEHIRATFPPGIGLPHMLPYSQRLQALNPPAAGKAYLPQWLWAHIEAGEIVPTVNLQPAF